MNNPRPQPLTPTGTASPVTTAMGEETSEMMAKRLMGHPRAEVATKKPWMELRPTRSY